MLTLDHATIEPTAEEAKTSTDTTAVSALNKLSIGDVAHLLRTSFWDVGGMCGADYAHRMVAIVAFMVFTHLGVKILARLPLSAWRPRDASGRQRDVVVVKERGHVRATPLSSDLIEAVEAYLEIRPSSAHDALFVTKSGKPLEESSFSLSFKTVQDRLGMTSPLPTMLKQFCLDRFAEASEAIVDPADREAYEEVVAAFLGRRLGNKHRPVSDVRLSALKDDVVELAPDMKACLYDDECGRQATYTTVFPDKWRSAMCVTTAGMELKPRLTAEDHPMVAELLAEIVPEKRGQMQDWRERMFVRYLPQIADLLVRDAISLTQLADLLKFSRSGLRERLILAFYGEDWWMLDTSLTTGDVWIATLTRYLRERQVGGSDATSQ
ncbi:MAG: hypothetical protein ABWX70_10585 [Hyphomicrobium sp.]